jgi:hypothetical protein
MTNHLVSLRFADSQTTGCYPGTIAGELTWSRSDGLWHCEIEIGALAAGTILAPSLSVLDNWPYDFRFQLAAGDALWPLPPVPSSAGVQAPAGSDSRVQGHLDCWHIHKPVEQARLRISCAAPREISRYLLTLSGRNLELIQMPPPPTQYHGTRRPPQYSQMLENPRIARRICSPVSLAMTLALHSRNAPLHELLPLCHDPATGMYGMWPLAVRAASRFGFLGAVELLSQWDLVTGSLDAGMPVVASIRYPAKGLPGSPMAATGGHLLVVYAVDTTHVHVNDPAAPDHGSVSRRYPLEQFTQAWFRHRGAAYILLP